MSIDRVQGRPAPERTATLLHPTAAPATAFWRAGQVTRAWGSLSTPGICPPAPASALIFELPPRRNCTAASGALAPGNPFVWRQRRAVPEWRIIRHLRCRLPGSTSHACLQTPKSSTSTREPREDPRIRIQPQLPSRPTAALRAGRLGRNLPTAPRGRAGYRRTDRRLRDCRSAPSRLPDRRQADQLRGMASQTRIGDTNVPSASRPSRRGRQEWGVKSVSRLARPP